MTTIYRLIPTRMRQHTEQHKHAASHSIACTPPPHAGSHATCDGLQKRGIDRGYAPQVETSPAEGQRASYGRAGHGRASEHDAERLGQSALLVAAQTFDFVVQRACASAYRARDHSECAGCGLGSGGRKVGATARLPKRFGSLNPQR